MFIFSVTFKLLSWTLALKYGDDGGHRRPWILGLVLGLVFAACDIFSGPLEWKIDAILLGAYLVSALAIMHVYHRTDGILLAILVCAVGTAVLFFGVPYLAFSLLSEE